MVIHAFPAAKLIALLVIQVSRPIANAAKQAAKSSTFFRKYICLPTARLFYWCDVKAKMWLLHLRQPVNIKVLNEAASIELSANLLGESIIFTSAALFLISEYKKSAIKEEAKEEARRYEVQEIRNVLKDLFTQIEERRALIKELTTKVEELEKSYFQEI